MAALVHGAIEGAGLVERDLLGLGKHDLDQALQRSILVVVEHFQPVDGRRATPEGEKTAPANPEHEPAGREANLQKAAA